MKELRSTMICAPITARSTEEVVSQMHVAKSEGADIAEIRLDLLHNFQPMRDLQIILRNKPLPLIIAFRQGLKNKNDEKARSEALFLAGDLGADFVEFELEMDISKLIEKRRESSSDQARRSKIMVSRYEDRPITSEDEMRRTVAKLRSVGADIIKLVVEASDITELPILFRLLSDSKTPTIAYSSGVRGLISQILAPKYGGFLVYGSIKGEHIPGLPSLAHLGEAYRAKDINKETKVFGLISKPVGHSKGPLLHNPALRLAGLNGIYVPMFVDNLAKFFSVFPSEDYIGFSVGFPYKEDVIEFCNEVHVQSIGASNTIIRRPEDGKLIGYNTDCEAAITAIEDALIKERSYEEVNLLSPLHGKNFVLVGAGGAGRALAFGAKDRGARVLVFDIDYGRAKALALAVDGEARPFEELSKHRPDKGSILANATPVGMHPSTDRIPVSQESLRDYVLVFDSVYTPRKTTLLKEAEAAGAVVVSGVEMFLRQAVGQFSLFTGGQAPVEFMREIIWDKF